MPISHIVCCDGTNNQFGYENTNVVRLIQILNRDPEKQRLYYDPGVGTLPEPNALTRVRKWISEEFGLVFGTGMIWKIQEAYCYLMNHWEPGDRVFLFGFSRGAYTARVLAGLLHSLGLLPRGNENLVPYVLRLFAGVRNQESTSKYWKLCNDFRWTFARKTTVQDDDRRFRVHFLGVWDTVSSVGWVWDPVKYPYTVHNPSIDVIRHAVSIDERRWFFRQNLMEKASESQDFQELWFPGVHSDVGGGYPESNGGIWRTTFKWMWTEAQKTGLLIDDKRLHRVETISSRPKNAWSEPIHESLTWRWWPAELFPKFPYREGHTIPLPRFGLGRHRTIKTEALIHQSALMRIREANLNYAPPNFSQEFLDSVRALTNIPISLAYTSTSKKESA